MSPSPDNHSPDCPPLQDSQTVDALAWSKHFHMPCCKRIPDCRHKCEPTIEMGMVLVGNRVKEVPKFVRILTLCSGVF